MTTFQNTTRDFGKPCSIDFENHADLGNFTWFPKPILQGLRIVEKFRTLFEALASTVQD